MGEAAAFADTARNREDTLLRALLENSSDVITILDARGTILYQSPSVERVLGYTQEELVGTNGFARIHPEDVEAARAAFRMRLEGRDFPEAVTYRFRHRDGSWRILEATGRDRLADPEVRGLVVNSHDVTERRRAEEAVARSERYFRSLFENAADVVTVLEADGTIRYESPSTERTVGWRSDELVGRNLFEFVHPDDAACTAATFEQILRNPGEVCAYQLRFRHADGSWRWLDGLGRNLLGDPAVRGVVANSRDVTDRRRAEEELLRAKEAAEAANRAKSQFLSSMSHELRTPLNSVIGFTNVLRANRGGRLEPQELLFLDRILANGTHLLGLINDVLDLAKIEAGKVELDVRSVDVAALARETLAELRGTVRDRDLELRLVAPEGAAPLETDPLKLKQVLINLVGNAIKFTERGTVTVTVRVHPRTRAVETVEVADTGVGIAADRIHHIFHAFEQAETGTTRRFGGTGLGLAICQSLTALLGYGVDVESTLGEGSTFRIVVAPSAPEGAGGEGCAAAPGVPGGHRAPWGATRPTSGSPGRRCDRRTRTSC